MSDWHPVQLRHATMCYRCARSVPAGDQAMQSPVVMYGQQLPGVTYCVPCFQLLMGVRCAACGQRMESPIRTGRGDEALCAACWNEAAVPEGKVVDLAEYREQRALRRAGGAT